MVALQARDLNVPETPKGKQAIKQSSNPSINQALTTAKDRCVDLIKKCESQCKNKSDNQSNNQSTSPPDFAYLIESLNDQVLNQTISFHSIGVCYETIGIWLFNLSKFTQSISIFKSASSLYKASKQTIKKIKIDCLIARAASHELENTISQSIKQTNSRSDIVLIDQTINQSIDQCVTMWQALRDQSIKLDLECESDIAYQYGAAIMRIAMIFYDQSIKQSNMHISRCENSSNDPVVLFRKAFSIWTIWPSIPSTYAPTQRASNQACMIKHRTHIGQALSQLSHLHTRFFIQGAYILNIDCLILLSSVYQSVNQFLESASTNLYLALSYARLGALDQSVKIAETAEALYDQSIKLSKAKSKSSTQSASQSNQSINQHALYHALKAQLHEIVSVNSIDPSVTQHLSEYISYSDNQSSPTKRPDLNDCLVRGECLFARSLIERRADRVIDCIADCKESYSVYSKLLRSMEHKLSTNQSNTHSIREATRPSKPPDDDRYADFFTSLSNNQLNNQSLTLVSACWSIISGVFRSTVNLSDLSIDISNQRLANHYLLISQSICQHAHLSIHQTVYQTINQQTIKMMREDDIQSEIDGLIDSFEQSNNLAIANSDNQSDRLSEVQSINQYHEHITALRLIECHAHYAQHSINQSKFDLASNHLQLALDSANHLIDQLIEQEYQSDDQPVTQSITQSYHSIHPLNSVHAKLASMLAALPQINVESLHQSINSLDECESKNQSAWATLTLVQHQKQQLLTQSLNQSSTSQPATSVKSTRPKRSTRNSPTEDSTTSLTTEQPINQSINPWNLVTASNFQTNPTINPFRQSNDQLNNARQTIHQSAPPRLMRQILVESVQCSGLIDSSMNAFLINQSMGIAHRHCIAINQREKLQIRTTQPNSQSKKHPDCSNRSSEEDDLTEAIDSLTIDDQSTNHSQQHTRLSLPSILNSATQSDFSPEFSDEHSRFQTFNQSIPSDWTIVTLVLSNDRKSLLCCRMINPINQPTSTSEDQPNVILKLPLIHAMQSAKPEKRSRSKQSVNQSNSLSDNQLDCLLAELSRILGASSAVNASIDPKLLSKESINQSLKEKWWSQRVELDQSMQQLLEQLEEQLFGPWKGVLYGQQLDQSVKQSIDHVIASTFEHVMQYYQAHNQTISHSIQQTIRSLIGCLAQSINQLSDCQLGDAFAYLFAMVDEPVNQPIKQSDSQSIDHTQLSATLQITLSSYQQSVIKQSIEFFRSQSEQSTSKLSKQAISQSVRGSVILILDPHLQCLPFESMPCLVDQPVNQSINRMITWTDIATRLDLVDRSAVKQSTKKAVKPSSRSSKSKSLPTSSAHQTKLQSIDQTGHYYLLNPSGDLARTEELFNELLPSIGFTNGDTGRLPARLIDRLVDRSLFLYIGHGSCDQHVARENIETLTEVGAVLLMGCSSARLKLVTSHLDGESMMTSFLKTGASCVVGNLWDVTDGDADRFTRSLLTNMRNGDTVDESVSKARDACKLKHLMGASPVVYGLPVVVKWNKTDEQ